MLWSNLIPQIVHFSDSSNNLQWPTTACIIFFFILPYFHNLIGHPTTSTESTNIFLLLLYLLSHQFIHLHLHWVLHYHLINSILPLRFHRVPNQQPINRSFTTLHFGQDMTNRLLHLPHFHHELIHLPGLHLRLPIDAQHCINKIRREQILKGTAIGLSQFSNNYIISKSMDNLIQTQFSDLIAERNQILSWNLMINEVKKERIIFQCIFLFNIQLSFYSFLFIYKSDHPTLLHELAVFGLKEQIKASPEWQLEHAEQLPPSTGSCLPNSYSIIEQDLFQLQPKPNILPSLPPTFPIRIVAPSPVFGGRYTIATGPKFNNSSTLDDSIKDLREVGKLNEYLCFRIQIVQIKDITCSNRRRNRTAITSSSSSPSSFLCFIVFYISQRNENQQTQDQYP